MPTPPHPLLDQWLLANEAALQAEKELLDELLAWHAGRKPRPTESRIAIVRELRQAASVLLLQAADEMDRVARQAGVPPIRVLPTAAGSGAPASSPSAAGPDRTPGQSAG